MGIGKGGWVGHIPVTSLRNVARHMALLDVWQMFWTRTTNLDDRGIALEKDWEALRIPFSTLREAERSGLIPSLVFSPMTVDDGRRLLISNLDFRFKRIPDDPLRVRDRLLPLTRGSSLLNHDEETKLSDYSLTGLEFFKAFPNDSGENDILISTAARMSASFPFVSPAVNLPSEPPLRVADAGYFDNYGVDVAAAWLFLNRQWLEDNTSGVLMIQIRDALSSSERLGVPGPPGVRARLLQGLQFFFTPLDAVMQARYTSSLFRNDDRVSALSDLFTLRTGDRDFFTTAIFELSANLTLTTSGRPEDSDSEYLWPGDELREQIDRADASGVNEVAMTWHLTTAERMAIDQAIPDVERKRKGHWIDPSYITSLEGERLEVRPVPDVASPTNREIASLKNEDVRRARIDRLKEILAKPLSPRQSAVLLKELGRAQNYEQIESIKTWWKIDHSRHPWRAVMESIKAQWKAGRAQ